MSVTAVRAEVGGWLVEGDLNAYAGDGQGHGGLYYDTFA